jgi:hypothetical protein
MATQINLQPAEVLEVLYSDSNPNLIYGIKVKILDGTPISGDDPEISASAITAKPLNTSFIRIPIVGEVVLILKAPSSYATSVRETTETYYLDIVSLQSSIHHNALPSVTTKTIEKGKASGDSDKYNESESGNNQQPKDPKIDVNFTENPTVKPLQPYIGDVLIAGRYGNSIRFSTTPKSGKFTVQPNWSGGSESAPITIFRNSKQGIDTKKINDYITEDFTNEENVIVQASGQNIIFEQASGVTTSIESKKITSWKDESWGTTPQTLISSGRLVFNSTQKEIIAFAKNGIGLSTETSIAIDAKEDVSINGTKIELGTEADEPLILGNKWKEWANGLIDDLAKLTVITPVGPSSPLSASPQWASIAAYKGKIDSLLSELSFTKKSANITTGKSSKVLAVPDFKMTPEDIAAVEQQVAEAKQEPAVAETPEQKQTRDEFINLKETELAEEEWTNAPADEWELNEDEIDENAKTTSSYIKGSDTPVLGSGTGNNNGNSLSIDSKAVGKGASAVKAAIKDIGKMEVPPKSNYGGRVTEMLKNTGINGPAYWCAAAVTTWWKDAGMSTPPGSASCDNWVTWAKKNNRWSSTPVIGAAALYFKGTDAHHIGLVAAITDNGRIVTIEGNTTGGGFNRDGVGVFKKQPRLTAIGGFVLPA